jgi:hypothetical protein
MVILFLHDAEGVELELKPVDGAQITRCNRPHLTYVLALTLGGWWVYQVSTARIFAETGGGVVQAPLRRPSAQSSNLPLDLGEYSSST